MTKTTQVITRKIQVIVDGKENLHTLYQWRDSVRRAANIIVTHKFCQDNIKDFVYVKDEIKDKFFVKDIIKDGKGMSEENTTYRVLSEYLKGNVPSAIYSTLNRLIASTYKKIDSKDIWAGKAYLRTYKNNIPMPFTKPTFESTKEIKGISKEGKGYSTYAFNFFGLPMQMFFGRDRSNNRIVVERCLKGEYSFCDSSIQIDDIHKKIYLLLSVKIPIKQVMLDSEKELLCALSLSTPIVAISNDKTYQIGDKESYLYKRKQFQESRKRLQIAMKYNVGGKGRARKCAALDRLEKGEYNYIHTLLHTYSRELINLAAKLNCGVIRLVNPTKEQIEEVKLNQQNGDDFIFRNWGWSGLSDLIKYKAEMMGIDVICPKDKKEVE